MLDSSHHQRRVQSVCGLGTNASRGVKCKVRARCMQQAQVVLRKTTLVRGESEFGKYIVYFNGVIVTVIRTRARGMAVHMSSRTFPAAQMAVWQ